MSATQLVHDSPGCSAVRVDGSGHIFFRYTVGFVLTADGVVCMLAATWLRCLHVGYVLVSWACECEWVCMRWYVFLRRTWRAEI